MKQLVQLIKRGPAFMSRHLMTLLPRNKWKMVKRITPSEAAALTGGNTDKFMNKDYWLLNMVSSIPLGGYKTDSEIPIGMEAVYYHDTTWWVVEKVAA
jgi:hypothetical protein